MRSVILEIKERFDIVRSLFNVSLSTDGFMRSGVARDCFELHGKSTCRYGKIDYGCYHRKNSCRKFF